MNRKPTFTNAVLNFLEGKGFYLVVLLCVAVVGFSGWYLATQVGHGTDDVVDAVTASGPLNGADTEVSGKVDGESGAPVSGRAEIKVPTVTSPAPTQSTKVTEPTPTTEPTPSAQPKEDKPAQTQNSEEGEKKPVPLVYTWPVKGEVLTDHSADELVYNETMGDWRVHTGMDIAAEPGTNVLATAAGTVAAVDTHDLMGTTVVIEHGEGMVSYYSNLQSVPTVGVGDEVYTGTVIGAVGSTAIAESAMASHLHFELTKNGDSVQPLDYLPQP